MFEKIKRFYDLGLYTAEQVQKFVEKGVITEEDLAEIDTVIKAQYPTMVDETKDSTEVTE